MPFFYIALQNSSLTIAYIILHLVCLFDKAEVCINCSIICSIISALLFDLTLNDFFKL